MIYPLVLELAADRIPVGVACRVLGFSEQAFYRWRADPVSQQRSHSRPERTSQPNLQQSPVSATQLTDEVAGPFEVFTGTVNGRFLVRVR
ncbi:hypothetical protein NS263_06645 [Curtobacterium oceanosedimentum]|uniref:Transposase n=1 Tax=Curtobacterium oceanosedimentum TaxID=465820 RepID=A0ABR5S729_9MICO|nr:hypothetical protein NS263_06645 [Curtobacterium oceanosedimentum]